jgi:hypothetical protein
MQGDLADHWAFEHADVTIAQAYRAGYLDGVREAQAKAAAFSPEGKTNRTVAAALALFRDQILSGDPEEVHTGEWLSAEEVTQLLDLHFTEKAHA